MRENCEASRRQDLRPGSGVAVHGPIVQIESTVDQRFQPDGHLHTLFALPFYHTTHD